MTIYIYPDSTGAIVSTERTDGRHYRGSIDEVKKNFLLDMKDRGFSADRFEFCIVRR